MTRAELLRAYVRLLVPAAVVVAVDQITKQIAVDGLRDGPVVVIDGVLSFRLALNPGGAFGLFQGLPGFFLIATVVVIVVILLMVRRLTDHHWIAPLGMVLGGGVGNFLDRVFRGFGGRVVDFIDVHVWPVFNVADAAIVVGAVLLLLFGSRRGKEAPR